MKIVVFPIYIEWHCRSTVLFRPVCFILCVFFFCFFFCSTCRAAGTARSHDIHFFYHAQSKNSQIIWNVEKIRRTHTHTPNSLSSARFTLSIYNRYSVFFLSIPSVCVCMFGFHHAHIAVIFSLFSGVSLILSYYRLFASAAFKSGWYDWFGGALVRMHQRDTQTAIEWKKKKHTAAEQQEQNENGVSPKRIQLNGEYWIRRAFA